MAEICCGVVSESDSSGGGDSTSRAARRRRIEIRRFKFLPPGEEEDDDEDDEDDGDDKDNCDEEGRGKTMKKKKKKQRIVEVGGIDGKLIEKKSVSVSVSEDCVGVVSIPALRFELGSNVVKCPKFGVASVCGRRRDMEDAVAIRPWLFHRNGETAAGMELHFFGVYDGHGCSHVAMRCSERLHELVREELESGGGDGETSREWKGAMERSFMRMDEEVVAWKNESSAVANASCRCELQTPDCDAVGSTAVVAIVTLDKIIVANCGDSRAVLSRNGKALALSSDHKPDRPDELDRIQAAGGRVIYWEGPRVLGVLSMSRAIGDSYLKPYVSSEPEVTVIDRTDEDDCLILASDGLWDVVSNETACGVARMCLRGKGPVPPEMATEEDEEEVVGSLGCGGETADRACSDASLLLTKLALARLSADNVSVVVVDLRKTDT